MDATGDASGPPLPQAGLGPLAEKVLIPTGPVASAVRQIRKSKDQVETQQKRIEALENAGHEHEEEMCELREKLKAARAQIVRLQRVVAQQEKKKGDGSTDESRAAVQARVTSVARVLELEAKVTDQTKRIHDLELALEETKTERDLLKSRANVDLVKFSHDIVEAKADEPKAATTPELIELRAKLAGVESALRSANAGMKQATLEAQKQAERAAKSDNAESIELRTKLENVEAALSRANERAEQATLEAQNHAERTTTLEKALDEAGRAANLEKLVADERIRQLRERVESIAVPCEGMPQPLKQFFATCLTGEAALHEGRHPITWVEQEIPFAPPRPRNKSAPASPQRLRTWESVATTYKSSPLHEFTGAPASSPISSRAGSRHSSPDRINTWDSSRFPQSMHNPTKSGIAPSQQILFPPVAPRHERLISVRTAPPKPRRRSAPVLTQRHSFCDSEQPMCNAPPLHGSVGMPASSPVSSRAQSRQPSPVRPKIHELSTSFNYVQHCPQIAAANAQHILPPPAALVHVPVAAGSLPSHTASGVVPLPKTFVVAPLGAAVVPTNLSTVPRLMWSPQLVPQPVPQSAHATNTRNKCAEVLLGATTMERFLTCAAPRHVSTHVPVVLAQQLPVSSPASCEPRRSILV